MARKKNKILPAKSSVFIYPKSVDDLSSHGHRLMIGFLGAILPIALWIVSCFKTRDQRAKLRRSLLNPSRFIFTRARA